VQHRLGHLRAPCLEKRRISLANKNSPASVSSNVPLPIRLIDPSSATKTISDRFLLISRETDGR
jgi:hypothetical protein